MRKASSILLMLSLVLPVICIYMHYHTSLYQIRKDLKHRMLEGIAVQELERLAFHQSDNSSQKWKHSREFVFRGQFYDIVDKEICGDSIIYFCWWDNEETQLNQQLDGVMANFMQRDPQQHQQQNRVLDFFKNFYFETYNQHQEVILTTAPCSYADITSFFSCMVESPPAPPPETALA